MVGVSRATWHYRKHPRPALTAPILQHERAYKTRISDADREIIETCIVAGWENHESVDHSFAQAWDEGVMVGSRRSWWRVAAGIIDQTSRPVTPVKSRKQQPRKKPVVQATGPGQVWSWDITDLYSTWWGKTFKAYKITDIYSRETVGWRVEDREADYLAVEMFEEAIKTLGPPLIVHADSGAAMRSNALKQTLTKHGVTLSFNRPYVSNDNPFSEAGFRTMKYRPGYPKMFPDLETARAYVAEYVAWYNTEHKHSGVALFTPSQVGDGSWKQVWATRDKALQAYYQKHPERFHKRPVTPAPASIVGINLPTKNKPEFKPD